MISTYGGSGWFEKYAFRTADAYMYTVGPPNGLGKLYQPGTRGIVFDDRKQSVSSIMFKLTSQTGSYASSYTCDSTTFNSSGYFSIYPNSSWTGLVYQDTAWNGHDFGLYNEIMGGDGNRAAIFPRHTANIADYTFDHSRWGDKPVGGSFDIWNEASIRGLVTPSDRTIAKWEAHVVLSRYIMPASSSQFGSIRSVRIPITKNPTSANPTYTNVTLNETYEYIPNYNGYAFRYYSGEFTANLPATTWLLAPVFILQNAGDATWRDTYYMVQTKFCFKAD